MLFKTTWIIFDLCAQLWHVYNSISFCMRFFQTNQWCRTVGPISFQKGGQMLQTWLSLLRQVLCIPKLINKCWFSKKSMGLSEQTKLNNWSPSVKILRFESQVPEVAEVNARNATSKTVNLGTILADGIRRTAMVDLKKRERQGFVWYSSIDNISYAYTWWCALHSSDEIGASTAAWPEWMTACLQTIDLRPWLMRR